MLRCANKGFVSRSSPSPFPPLPLPLSSPQSLAENVTREIVLARDETQRDAKLNVGMVEQLNNALAFFVYDILSLVDRWGMVEVGGVEMVGPLVGMQSATKGRKSPISLPTTQITPAGLHSAAKRHLKAENPLSPY